MKAFHRPLFLLGVMGLLTLLAGRTRAADEELVAISSPKALRADLEKLGLSELYGDLARKGAATLLIPEGDDAARYFGDLAPARDLSVTALTTRDGHVTGQEPSLELTAYIASTQPLHEVVGDGHVVHPSADGTSELERARRWLGEDCPQDRPILDEDALRLYHAWQASQAAVERTGAATGILMDPSRPDAEFLGSAWVFDQGFGEIVTAAHVLTVPGMATWQDGVLTLSDDAGPDNLVFELPTNAAEDEGLRYPVTGIAMSHQDQDIVVLRVDPEGQPALPKAPRILTATASLRRLVGRDPYVEIWGFPSRAMVKATYDPAAQKMATCSTHNHYDQRLLSVGPMEVGATGAPDHGQVPLMFRHWADTLPGTSGGPILDLDTGAVLGVQTCASTTAEAEECPGAASLLAPPDPEEPDDRRLRFNIGWNTASLCAWRPSRCTDPT